MQTITPLSDELKLSRALDSLRLTRFLRRTGSYFAGKRSSENLQS
jgi:hypothetical protein